MSQIILCISDHPEKFSKLRGLAFTKNIVLVTTCRYYHALEYFKGPDTIVGVALDFEMPFGTGPIFIQSMSEENISVPIVITEKDKYGVKRVVERLQEFGYENYAILPYNVEGWERKALDFWILNLIPEALKLSEYIFNSEPLE